LERVSALDELLAAVPDVVTDPDILVSLARDSADLFGDDKPASPLAAVRPRTTAEVAAAVRVAARHGIPVVPQGARTGLAGGANAVDGALLICLDRMDQILSIDTANRVAVVQPGVVNATLRRAAAEHGLFYPPDPSSWESSSIGGNVSTNAGGMCCVKYGVTTEYVLGLEVVLADGEILRCGRRTAKGVAGYDLTRLFVGSEGTLGVITEITVSLRPARYRRSPWSRCSIRYGRPAPRSAPSPRPAPPRACWSCWTGCTWAPSRRTSRWASPPTPRRCC
jgi:glycolate oxidase